jgi:hypothetical protein
MAYTLEYIKGLPAPSVKKLLREANHNLSSVARRRQIAPSIVSRVVSRQVTSWPVWEDIVWALNHPQPQSNGRRWKRTGTEVRVNGPDALTARTR